VRVALDPGGARQPARIQRLAEDGEPLGAPQVLSGPQELRQWENQRRPRWVLASPRSYRRLLRAGITLDRYHDVELVEGLLVAAAGRFGQPHGLAAALARLQGREPEPDPRAVDDDRLVLFDPTPATDELADIVTVHATQQRALTGGPAGMRLLATAESAAALVAEEMSAEGLPWDAGVHDGLLTDLLGARPALGGPPPKLAALAAAVTAAFGGRAINPDSPAEVLRAFARAGHELQTTRSWELRRVDHPAVEPLLAYKELARLHAAHGWAWLRTWVREGRFRPEYVVGGVVSGRWASRGGGALQIPRALRAAVRADPGWRLVVADAAQLEPRVLAALSGDHALAPGEDDLYGALAAAEFGGDRDKAKLALLSAMYGASGGEAGQLLGVLRRRFPVAMAYVDSAARAGEEGRLVRSHLGRTCPPARPGQEQPARARARGRFTRNFVVQATAAEWANVLLAELRMRLRAAASPARPVFFQHDEVLLHAPAEAAEQAAEAVHEAARSAGRRLFGESPVRFPMQIRVVTSYDQRGNTT
jgi:DNA polymerase-1